jgi:hypothetical protein
MSFDREEPVQHDSSLSPTTVEGTENRYETIFNALSDLLVSTDENAGVVVSDSTTNKFVQFASVDSELFFDLPAQSLDESELLLATEYFKELGGQMQEYQLMDAPGGRPAATQLSFQLNLENNVEAATKLTMDIFDSVYRVPRDSSLVLEEI